MLTGHRSTGRYKCIIITVVSFVAGSRRQFGQTQVPVHCVAFWRTERKPGRVRPTVGRGRQERSDQHCRPYSVPNGRFCRSVYNCDDRYLLAVDLGLIHTYAHYPDVRGFKFSYFPFVLHCCTYLYC